MLRNATNNMHPSSSHSGLSASLSSQQHFGYSDQSSKVKVNFQEQSRNSNNDSDISYEDYEDIDENVVKNQQKPAPSDSQKPPLKEVQPSAPPQKQTQQKSNFQS